MKLTEFLVVVALHSIKGAQPEEVSWIGKSADMLIKVTCYTFKLTLPWLDKLQALTGVSDSVLQLLIQVHRCVKSSDKHCNFFVGMLSAHTHSQYQAATAWLDRTMLKSSGVRATLACNVRCVRCGVTALVA